MLTGAESAMAWRVVGRGAESAMAWCRRAVPLCWSVAAVLGPRRLLVLALLWPLILTSLNDVAPFTQGFVVEPASSQDTRSARPSYTGHYCIESYTLIYAANSYIYYY